MISGNCNPEVSLHLYKTLVLPTLEYFSPVWCVHKRKHIDTLERIQRRASRMILRQIYMEQSYLDRHNTLGIKVLTKRKYLFNLSFIAKQIVFNTSCFGCYFLSNFKVNSRHSDVLTFYHAKPRTDSFKYSVTIRFPKVFSELSVETRNSLVLDSFKMFRSVLRDDIGS